MWVIPCSDHRGLFGLTWLRCYPPKFGLKLVELFHDLIADKAGMPELPSKVPTALETFTSMDFDDTWPEAQMAPVCHFLRGGVRLSIPRSFWNHLPQKL